MPASGSRSGSRSITDRGTVADGVRLLLVRHGRTAWNEAGRYQGQSDPPLSPEGEAEAAALAGTLRGERVGCVLASPLRRAAATAAILARALSLPPPVTDPRLIELGYGAWEGLTQAEVKARWPMLLRCWKRTPETVRFPDGEDLATVRARLDALLAARPWEPAGAAGAGAAGAGAVLLVTHAGPIRLLRLAAEARPLAEFRRIETPPASLHALQLEGGRLRLAEPALAVMG